MLALLPFLLAAAPVPDNDLAGSWDLDAGGTTIFWLEIAKAPDGTTATWVRPEHFETDGDTFSRLSGPVVRRKARSLRSVDGDIEVSFDDPRPGARPDIMRLHRVDAGHMDATYVGTGLSPFHFTLGGRHPAPFGPWDGEHEYELASATRPSNPEMAAIFDADQADRKAGAKIDWSVVKPADEKRRKRTQELLDAGQLQSAQDYFGAAFVFQHGSKPDDFLKAHLLAMVAVARGKPSAIWIASATLDRYLQNIGKPQVLGTQFSLPRNAPATQEPYDRTLVSDAMRRALKVPPQAAQEEQRLRYQAESDAAKAAPKP